MKVIKYKGDRLEMLNIEQYSVIYPEQLWLYFSEEDKEKAWSTEHKYSNDAPRWNAFLNRLCLNKVTEWLQGDSGFKVAVCPSDEALSSIWEVVNGTAMQLGKTRWILIPSEASDTEEFCVPQEWVDIPSWAGNYYLAVQINLLENWLRVWGYATHQRLKSQGMYDKFDRSYSLDGENLINDLNVIWVKQELSPHETEATLAVIEALPQVSTIPVEQLLEKLSQPSPYSPRREIPFTQWAILIADDQCRQKLYERRQELLVQPTTIKASAKKTVNLSKWLHNVFEDSWQSIESLFGTEEAKLAFGFRDRRIEKYKFEVIKQLIDQIYTSRDEEQRKQAAEKLGKSGTGDQNVIAALIHLLNTTDDQETRWTAAESLWTIDPDNPVAGIKRITDLGMQLAGNPVALMVGILPKPLHKLAILLRVYPMGSKNYLPEALQLKILDNEGDLFLETQARKADNFIQLKFSGSPGDEFSIKIGIDNVQITEYFVI
ncbi:DUF1822 family protein [Nostoc sp. CHAB 5836]|uniref:DUF1822 family protein n=1 Tax=Nostoc sp. CHAB 5836 TaxID=2780404 RepID=UPI001E5EBE10|nr:DUF1822 family protein [Nostoc sp. CHAB 5836]MCC5619277.1 DUF1822 family protein [Nostoc sp. CHAB 5836]